MESKLDVACNCLGTIGESRLLGGGKWDDHVVAVVIIFAFLVKRDKWLFLGVGENLLRWVRLAWLVWLIRVLRKFVCSCGGWTSFS